MDIIWLTLIEDQQVCDPYANWLMSRNKWIYILGIFCKDKFHVSKDCGSLAKKLKEDIQREIDNSL
jgi:hypothetical protein